MATVRVLAAATMAGFAAEAQVLHHLTDPSWTWDNAPKVLNVGAKVWNNQAETFATVPSELIGATFWPGLGYRSCPPGTLRLNVYTGGILYAWHNDREHDGGMYTIDDDIANGWHLFGSGTLSWSPKRHSAVVYAKPIPDEGAIVDIDIHKEWAGGVAYSTGTSTLPQQIQWNLTWIDQADFDNAPRKLEPGRKLNNFNCWPFWQHKWHDRLGFYFIFDLDPMFDSSHYWPGLDVGLSNSPTSGTASAWFATDSAGTLFVLVVEGSIIGGGGGSVVVIDGWELLGRVNPFGFNVVAKYLPAGSREELPRKPGIPVFREGWNFKDELNTTAASVAEAKAGGQLAVLTHPQQTYGPPPKAVKLEVGAPVLMDDALSRVVSLPAQLVNAIIFSSFSMAPYGPAGVSVTLESLVDGSMLIWALVGCDKGLHGSAQVHALDDDPSSGWSRVGTAKFSRWYPWSQTGVEDAIFYGRRVAAAFVTTWAFRPWWLGGIGFSSNDSLAAVDELPFSATAASWDPLPIEFRFKAMINEGGGHYIKILVTDFMVGATYFVGLARPYMPSGHTLDFHTSVCGTLFVVGSVKNFNDMFAELLPPLWWFCGYVAMIEEGSFGVDTRLAIGRAIDANAIESVRTPPNGRWHGTLAFSATFDLTATTASTTEAVAHWSHRHWYIEKSGELVVGALTWASDIFRHHANWSNVRYGSYTQVPADMVGAKYWPSLEGRAVSPPGSLELTTLSSGAVFVWAEEHGGRTGEIFRLDDDLLGGWAFFDMGLYANSVAQEPNAQMSGYQVVYAKNVVGPSVVQIPYAGLWHGGAGFRNATVVHPTRSISLTHPAWSFDDVPRILEKMGGAWPFAWSDVDVRLQYPVELEGASFWPGLRETACPIGVLLFHTEMDGRLWAWGRTDANSGGIDALDDVVASGWELTAMVMTDSRGKNYQVFGKAIPAWCQADIAITTTWSGGVAFRPAVLPTDVPMCTTTTSSSTTKSASSTTSTMSATTSTMSATTSTTSGTTSGTSSTTSGTSSTTSGTSSTTSGTSSTTTSHAAASLPLATIEMQVHAERTVTANPAENRVDSQKSVVVVIVVAALTCTCLVLLVLWRRRRDTNGPEHSRSYDLGDIYLFRQPSAKE